MLQPPGKHSDARFSLALCRKSDAVDFLSSAVVQTYNTRSFLVQNQIVCSLTNRLLGYFYERQSHLPHRWMRSWASQSAVLQPCPRADNTSSVTHWNVLPPFSFGLYSMCLSPERSPRPQLSLHHSCGQSSKEGTNVWSECWRYQTLVTGSGSPV